jgi:hypothetical protein
VLEVFEEAAAQLNAFLKKMLLSLRKLQVNLNSR